MTYLRNIILPFMLLLAFAGCTQDEVETVAPGEIRFTLNVPALNMPGELPSKSVSPEPGESTISNVYLLFYEQSASDADRPIFFYSQTGLSNENNWSKTFKTTEMAGLKPHIGYDVYALASPPSSVSAPTESTTKAMLLTLEENLTDQNVSSWAISFSGQSAYTTGRLGEQTINLKRTVARLDIILDNQIGAQNLSLTMVKEPSSVFYLKNNTGSSLTSSNRTASTTAAGDYRFYLYEHTAGSDPVRIYLNGTTPAGRPIFHLIDLQHNGSSEIKRNHIYKIALTLK